MHWDGGECHTTHDSSVQMHADLARCSVAALMYLVLVVVHKDQKSVCALVLAIVNEAQTA